LKRRSTAFIATALALSACSQFVPGITEISYVSNKLASIRGQTKDFSRLLVSVVREPEVPVFKIQKLPAAYTSADLVLSNYGNPSLLSANLSKSLAIANGTTQATGVYAGLKPGDNYKLACTLKNNATAVGSGYADSITLRAGVNLVTIIISVLGDIKVLTSENKNTFGDSGEWIIVKGDTYTFDTGFDADEKTKTTTPSGNLKMQVIFSSVIYNGGTAQPDRILAETTSAFNTWSLVSSVSVTPTAQPGFNKQDLRRAC